MFAKRLIALFAALAIGCAVTPANAQSHNRAEIEVLAQFYAQYYDVPHDLVRRVINRESTFNPSARNGPYYGLMQILPATAKSMGFRGQPADLLNAETNLIYAVKYLRGAWLLANGSHDRAVQLYAKGYYYEAKAAGLLEETGLRPGPTTPVAPTPPTATVIVAATPPAPIPAPVEAVAAAVPDTQVIAVAAVEPQALEATSIRSVPLGFLPPSRPLGLALTEEAPAPSSAALEAIAAAQAPIDNAPAARSFPAPRPITVAAVMDDPASVQAVVDQLRPPHDLVASTFALLDSMATAQR